MRLPTRSEICDSGSIGFLYDCVNRVPSTAVLNSDEYLSKYTRSSKHFKQSHLIGIHFYQHDKDYEQALRRVPCFVAGSSNYYVEHNWWRSITTTRNAPYARKSRKTCDHTISIHRGHLIAVQYKPTGNEFTFIYTNAIPQFGSINSGRWINSIETATPT